MFHQLSILKALTMLTVSFAPLFSLSAVSKYSQHQSYSPVFEPSEANKIKVALVDQSGAETKYIEANPGTSYSVLGTQKAPQLVLSGKSPNNDGILVRNDTRHDSIRVRLYRKGRIVFESSLLSPGQRTVFPTSSQKL